MSRIYLIPILIFCWTLEAAAQEVPSGIEPGQIEKRFEAPRQPQEAAPELVIPYQEDLTQPEQAEDIRFVFSGIVFEGMTVYAEPDLLSLYQDKLVREIALTDIYKIADALTAKYRNDGYLLSRVIVPPQRIQNGIVRFQVIEGYINKIIIDETINGSMRLLEKYADKIRRTRPLTAKALEHYLLLANDLPGVTVRAVFMPSKEQPGAADLKLIAEQNRFNGFSSIDNRGSRFIGAYQVQAGLAVNGLLGVSHRSQLRAITATQLDELIFFEFEHEQSLNAAGTKAIFTLRNTESEPGFTLRDLDIDTDSVSGELVLSHPFIRSRQSNLSGRISFNYRNSDTDILTADFSEDRLRGLRAGFEYDRVDSRGNILFADVELSQGLDILNASESGSLNLSRASGESDYTKITAELLYLLRLRPRWNLLLGFKGQYAADSLLSSEQFALGGAGYGRAYDPSELAGDHGAALKSELQYNFFHGFGNIPASFQLFTYHDIGAVENRDTSSTSFRSESLASAGLGVRFSYARWFSGSIEAAFPLTRDVAARGQDGDEPRLFFNMKGRF